eukprot:1161577-Prorocentrum_minimum.AAC.1
MPRTLSAQTCSTTTAPLSITATRCSLSSSPPERSSGTTTATSRCALRIQCYDNVTRALCIVLHYCHGSSRGCYTTVTAPHVGVTLLSRLLTRVLHCCHGSRRARGTGLGRSSSPSWGPPPRSRRPPGGRTRCDHRRRMRASWRDHR